ncbi:MAG: SDR family oxidoreductase [Clostridiales bacterium]|nr:SDR family oxidoreductase [Clostridiales bacterium]
MRALLVGGTGRISTSVTYELLKQGWDVSALNRGGKNTILPERVTKIVANINDEATVSAMLANQNYDVIVQFISFKPNNIERDARLFKNKSKQYIFISSASVYSKTQDSYILNENSAVGNPFWKYAQEKLECERLLKAAYNNYEVPLTIVRPSHIYNDSYVPVGFHGYNGSWQVLKRMLDGKPVIVHGDGTSLWTITHAVDFAKGLVGIMGNSNAIGETFNIVSDEAFTWNQMYQMIADALGVELKTYNVPSEMLSCLSPDSKDLRGRLTGDKSNCMVFDNSKIKNFVPGFKTSIPFAEGVKETIENILANPEYQRADEHFDYFCDRLISACEDLKNNFNKNI